MDNAVQSGPPHAGRPEVFWGEIAPSEHLVQFYEDGDVFLNSLEEFVWHGFQSGDSVIVIATSAHLAQLGDRLRARGVDLASVQDHDEYLALDADEVLARFVELGWPNEELFRETVSELLTRAKKDGRRVRAFGEMVALLWARGHRGATVRLEHLWHEYCKSERFSLYCAYPKVGFPQDAAEALEEICAAHSRVVAS